MKIPLKEITDIRSGHLFRTQIRFDVNGDKLVIRPTDMDNATSRINYENLERISEDVSKDAILSEHDVIVKAKGNNNKASYVSISRYKMVPTNHFIIIRINNDKIFPKYLAWFLNRGPAQSYFRMMTGGTSTQNLKIETLGNLKISIPQLEIQKKIVDVHELLEKEQYLLDRISVKRNKMVENLLLKVVKSNEQ